MIQQPTVFVLGAGASAAFGFPTGPELVAQILEKKTELVELYCNYLRQGSDWELEEFLSTLRSSKFDSIDAFLKQHTQYSEIGKLAIAQILCNQEHIASGNETKTGNGRFSFDGPLFDNYLHHEKCTEQNWLMILLNRILDAPIDHFCNNQVTFITFNYDRTLEHFLHTTLIHRFGITSTESASLMNSIPIYHIHGHLGLLPWQSGSNIPRNEMSRQMSDVSPVHIRGAANSLRIVSEGKDSSGQVSLAKEALKEASLICFIGFGFREENKWLFEEAGTLTMPGRSLNGTAFEFTDAEIYDAKERWRNDITLHTCKSHDFLRQCHDLFAAVRGTLSYA